MDHHTLHHALRWITVRHPCGTLLNLVLPQLQIKSKIQAIHKLQSLSFGNEHWWSFCWPSATTQSSHPPHTFQEAGVDTEKVVYTICSNQDKLFLHPSSGLHVFIVEGRGVIIVGFRPMLIKTLSYDLRLIISTSYGIPLDRICHGWIYIYFSLDARRYSIAKTIPTRQSCLKM